MDQFIVLRSLYRGLGRYKEVMRFADVQIH